MEHERKCPIDPFTSMIYPLQLPEALIRSHIDELPGFYSDPARAIAGFVAVDPDSLVN